MRELGEFHLEEHNIAFHPIRSSLIFHCQRVPPSSFSVHHIMLRIVEFALQLCSDNTERSSPLIRVTTARDICLEAFNELQNRVDLLQDQAACQTTGIITCKRNRSQKPGFQHLHAYLQQRIIEFTCRSLRDTARLFPISSVWRRNICENSCKRTPRSCFHRRCCFVEQRENARIVPFELE